MQTDQTLKLENQICFAIYACSRELTKLYRPLLQELGLTYTQYVTMLALWEQDQVTVSTLGAKLYLDSGTLTPLLKKLEAAGHITRTRDKNDERNVVIALTEQGRQLREQAVDIPEKLLCQLDASPEEGGFLLTQMQELMARVQQRTNSAANIKGDE
ncbi:MarR family transcriptional regulator [Paenibacillus pinisoli]|uniref:MarR family transcriptional regulator n=1 Tax=Paenibacillus pinisoli TaxID=1276110 RepID=A0A3A6Q293_9BACL|nr:MarR family transcriptional regulator [Paenibacillus pinisoli]RJX40104.1 MarR family transcriptional regulator [Paenibacillus pinisoli]